MPQFISIFTHPSLLILTLILIFKRGLKQFKFVEIGVFKGDNAVLISRFVSRWQVDLHYIGFDLFDESEAFYREHLSEYDFFNSGKSDYWEFKSGEHGIGYIQKKLDQYLPESSFQLIQGNSLETVPANAGDLTDTDIFYIDGAHDYEYVREDWKNVSALFRKNPDMVVVFDDLGFEGIQQVKDEIDQDDHYQSYYLNHNQFFVLSQGIPKIEKQLLTVASYYFKGILHLKRFLTRGRTKA